MTTSDQSYESVKPVSFMTVPTSHTSCQRSQVKSRNHGKTHIFQHRIKYFEASSCNSRKEKKERAKLWTRTRISKQTNYDHRN